MTPDEHRIAHLRYAAVCTYVDDCFGKVLDKLEEVGELDNTFIFFTSDHGDMMGDHGLFQKGPMYDGSTRVPLLVRFPGTDSEQRRVYEPISQIDLLPTLLDLMDQPIPQGLHGQSWRPFLEGADGFESGDAGDGQMGVADEIGAPFGGRQAELRSM